MVCACNPSDGEMKGGRQRQVDPRKLMGQLSGSTWQSSRSMRDPVSNKSWKVPENHTPGFPLTSPHTENTCIRAPSHSNSHMHTHKRVKEKKTKDRNSSKYRSLIHRSGNIQKKTFGHFMNGALFNTQRQVYQL